MFALVDHVVSHIYNPYGKSRQYGDEGANKRSTFENKGSTFEATAPETIISIMSANDIGGLN